MLNKDAICYQDLGNCEFTGVKLCSEGALGFLGPFQPPWGPGEEGKKGVQMGRIPRLLPSTSPPPLYLLDCVYVFT